ncbi:MAG: carboxypeptidase regulatory-like domain-containing protein [Proteobacteria bacterium]|nr:carboxypeptidase regulatory-like domain-containing protein [Pseudomonadota bacterium]
MRPGKLKIDGFPGAALLLSLLVACGPGAVEGIEGTVAGECTDDADNDADGLFDCNDPDCSGAAACAEGDTDADTDADTDTDADADTDADTDTDTGSIFTWYVNTTEPPTGTHTCHTPGSSWLTQSVDSARVDDFPFSGIVADFETEDPVSGATVELRLNDEVGGSADRSAVSGSNGELSLSVPSCLPLTYRVATDALQDETRVSYTVHQVFHLPNATIGGSLNSLSTITYRLVPSLLGVSVDADKATVWGTVRDCAGQPYAGAQLLVRGSGGAVLEPVSTHYFRDRFPNRDQLETSADGHWLAANVPSGPVTIEAYVYNGSGYDLLGATEVTVVADAVMFSDITTGYGSGVVYPPSCLVR